MLGDEGESLESITPPSDQLKKSLEEQLASVMEGEGISVIGFSDESDYGDQEIFVAREPNIIQLNQPRRRRRRMRAQTLLGTSPSVSNQGGSRVSVGLRESGDGTFKVTSVRIVYASHERSPFVVSLRGMPLSTEVSHEDERVSFSEASAFDVEPEAVPSVSILGAMANDLYLGHERIDTNDQFTRTAKRSSTFFEWADRLSRFFFRSMRSVRRPFERRVATDRVNPIGRSRKKSTKRVFSLKGLLKIRKGVSASSSNLTFDAKDHQPGSDREVVFDLDIDHDGRVIVETSDTHSSNTKPRIIRSLATLSLLILIAMIPANVIRLVRDLRARQAAVAATSDQALGLLKGLSTDGQLQTSIETLRLASGEFRNADQVLSETNALAVGLANLLPSTRKAYSSARALMEIGEKTSRAGQLLAKGLDSALSGSGSILERIASVRAYAQGVIPLLDDAAQAFTSVDVSVVPEDAREKVDRLGSFVEDARSTLRDFVSMSDLMMVLLGKEESRRYLVVFQNPTELRATGGFMGSFAELDVDQGEIVRLEIPGGGTYDVKGGLSLQVIPPKPLQLIASRWEFQDSNWSPDFPTAAEKIRWFWSKSGGYTVDGVIAVNATIVEKLLTVTGPIELPELGKTITSENFMEETQRAVELEYDKEENQPKKILSLLAPRLMERLKALDSKGVVRLVSIVSESIENKDIQIALTDSREEEKVEAYGWSGRIKNTEGDALAIIGSNIAGQKTDGKIKERVSVKVDISEDGRMTDSVSLTRTHTGTKGDLFSGVRNVEYVRFYVPRGSTLVEASGFDVIPSSLFKTVREDAGPDRDVLATEGTARESLFNVSVWDEGNRTVIGGWTMLDPGHEATISVSYRLPFTVYDVREMISDHMANASDGRSAYELLLTSQSGKTDREIDVSIEVPETWKTNWIRSASSVNGLWNRDRVVSALFETK